MRNKKLVENSAFPLAPTWDPARSKWELEHPGMTMRQWYAGLAMQTILQDKWYKEQAYAEIAPHVAADAFAMADAMLAEEAK